MGAGQSTEDLIFELNSNARSLQRDAEKCIAQSNASRNKAKQFLKDNRRELAEQEAQVSAVQEEQAIEFERMATQLETHIGELKLLLKGNTISTDMERVNSRLTQLLKKQDVRAAVELLESYKTNQGQVGVKVDAVQNVMEEQMDGVAGVVEKNSVMQRLEAEIGLEEGQRQLMLGEQQCVVNEQQIGM